MAFGNAVNDFTQVAASGTAGYIIAINLISNRMRKVDTVQPFDSVSGYGDVVTAPIALSALYGLLNEPLASIPDCAFAQTSATLFVFFKTSVYAYDANSRIGIFYWRNAIPVAVVGDYRDRPQEAKNLAQAISIRMLYDNPGERTPFDVGENFRREKKKLLLT